MTTVYWIILLFHAYEALSNIGCTSCAPYGAGHGGDPVSHGSRRGLPSFAPYGALPCSISLRSYDIVKCSNAPGRGDARVRFILGFCGNGDDIRRVSW